MNSLSSSTQESQLIEVPSNTLQPAQHQSGFVWPGIIIGGVVVFFVIYGILLRLKKGGDDFWFGGFYSTPQDPYEAPEIPIFGTKAYCAVWNYQTSKFDKETYKLNPRQLNTAREEVRKYLNEDLKDGNPSFRNNTLRKVSYRNLRLTEYWEVRDGEKILARFRAFQNGWTVIIQAVFYN